MTRWGQTTLGASGRKTVLVTGPTVTEMLGDPSGLDRPWHRSACPCEECAQTWMASRRARDELFARLHVVEQ